MVHIKNADFFKIIKKGNAINPSKAIACYDAVCEKGGLVEMQANNTVATLTVYFFKVVLSYCPFLSTVPKKPSQTDGVYGIKKT